jgi:hypothetical protein
VIRPVSSQVTLVKVVGMQEDLLHHRQLLSVAELIGRVGGGDREYRCRDFPDSFSAFSRHCWFQTSTAKIEGPKDRSGGCLSELLGRQLGTGDILTLDRDFTIYRWGRNKPFRVLPSADLHRRRTSSRLVDVRGSRSTLRRRPNRQPALMCRKGHAFRPECQRKKRVSWRARRRCRSCCRCRK